MKNIHFFVEETSFVLKHKTNIRSWINATVNEYQKEIQNLNYIFTTDAYLLSVNKEYLNHNTLTDIITFDQSVDQNIIEADIFVSVERIKENATKYRLPLQDELHRVMIHGVLHLLGYRDKTEIEKREMRKKENHYLALRF